jgi:hypothetical protein
MVKELTREICLSEELSELVDDRFDALAEEWQWGQNYNYYPCTSVELYSPENFYQ